MSNQGIEVVGLFFSAQEWNSLQTPLTSDFGSVFGSPFEINER